MKQAHSMSSRWSLTVLLLVLAVGIVSPAFAQEKSRPAKPPRDWNWKTGDVAYQLITVEKHPKFQIQGLSFESKIRFKILSKLSMRISPLDRSLTIRQKVETTKLEEADALSKALLTKMLQDLTGKTITIRLSAEGEVTRIEGVPEPMAQAVTNGLDVRGAMLTSIIDRDGWKELTLATLFTPPQTLAADSKWEQPISHGWGPLGSWQGKTRYQPKGRRENLDLIGYEHSLRYHPPAQGQGRNLPFQIANPKFQVKESQGTLRYDPVKGRLSSMEEKFHVAGQMMIQIAGQNLPMQLEEVQTFQLELFDKKPAADQR